MKLEEISQMTNEKGQRFASMWLKGCTILGTERMSSNVSRQEFTVIFKHEDGSMYSAILPDAGTVNDGSCFFGPFDYFAAHYAADKAGFCLKYSSRTYLHPVWYAPQDKLKVYNQAYNEIVNKYNPQSN